MAMSRGRATAKATIVGCRRSLRAILGTGSALVGGGDGVYERSERGVNDRVFGLDRAE